MATPRKALPIAARAAVRDAQGAAQSAASLIRRVRLASTRETPGDTQLADALTDLERIQRLLGETIGGSMADREIKGRPVPSVGRMVHFVYGDKHCAAVITDPSFVVAPGQPGNTALTVFPPNEAPFTTIAFHDEFGGAATWHWMEFVPSASTPPTPPIPTNLENDA